MASLTKTMIQLQYATKKLSLLPSSTADLLHLLKQLEEILSKVQQSPSKSINNALKPIIEGIFAKELVRHADMNVNISVACCICEIMRIMSPKTPYNDEQTKDLFEMVVITFEKLSFSNGGCYAKMRKVLKTFSTLRLWVLMLDLKLDGHGLIVRLFKQFLTVANSNSSAIVFEMEKIMTMIIDENKELAPELLRLIVTTMERDNQEAKETIPYTTHKIKLKCPETLKSCQDAIRHTVNEKQAQSVEHGGNLVGSRIEVWWPADRMYYPGVVTFFDFKKKRHKVLYDDGDVELIDLKRQRWKWLEYASALPGSLEHTLPDTVRVHGYNVKQSVAPVLEAIINKHGDIAAKCVFKAASVRASLLELVCDIVKQLEPKTDGVIDKMEDIENQVSSVEKANINGSWLQAHLKAINKTNDGKTDLLTG
ncbi:sister chromatid cohesion protein PDS5 homolog A isoform X3 [Helianthus annuus]|uniref:sister chromatid cohesion protein PDS5 homolog A isoform X3 n=1 Tax=Helianthus annuus TaxID=4232 RepID=UPI000B8FF968|nr:sister chromatid cohesion protein PDS5 homolog A isoform X3 [Helianthus annuus]